MKITVSIGGPFPTPFRWAEFLEEQNCLERMITFMPEFRLRSRLQVTLSRKHLISFSWLGYLNHIQWRLLGRSLASAYWISNKFDRLASQHLGSCDVFNGWSLVALESMRRAKSFGAVTVLNTGSTHIAFQRRLMEAEYEKFGLRRSMYDERMIVKGTREFIEADHIIVASTFVRRSLLAEGIPSTKISIVPDAVTRRFRPAIKEDSVFRIIAVGRIELRKGIQYLLDAVRQLRLPNSELLLVGGLQSEFEPIVKEYEGLYRLAGTVSDDELGRLYGQSSVLVLPSVEDGWSHVCLEAMSCGVPAIVSANAGSADAVVDGVNGYVVPACDARAIMEKLELLYNDPTLRDEMGRQALASVRNRTWRMYGEQNKCVFDDLVLKQTPSQLRP